MEVETTVCVGLEAGCAENSFVFSFFLFIVIPSFANAVSVEGAGAGCSTVVDVEDFMAADGRS